MKHGVPNVLFFGEHGGYKVLVMQMLGPTLKEMKDFSKKQKFSGKTILKIAIQLVSIFFVIIWSFGIVNFDFGRFTEMCLLIFCILLFLSDGRIQPHPFEGNFHLWHYISKYRHRKLKRKYEQSICFRFCLKRRNFTWIFAKRRPSTPGFGPFGIEWSEFPQ